MASHKLASRSQKNKVLTHEYIWSCKYINAQVDTHSNWTTIELVDHQLLTKLNRITDIILNVIDVDNVIFVLR